ncbi:MAG: S-layer homology domain-containing protein [Peptostreptococcaceae bacterium]
MEEMVNMGVVSGYEDNTFRPNNGVTRAEFVKLINHYLDLDRVIENNNFIDVSKGSWYFEEVAIAVYNGYINGYEDNTFRPNENITREEACKVLATILDFESDHINDIFKFNDYEDISTWALKYVEGIIDEGLMKGNDQNKLNPKSSLSRAEAITLLSRIENRINSIPTITMQSMYIELESNFDYSMLNATAYDKEDGDLTSKIEFSGYVNTSISGSYKVTAKITDNNGAWATRTVTVIVRNSLVNEEN